MGLFGSKKKVIVATQVARVIEDKLLPDAVKTGSINALMGSGQFIESVMEEMITSIGIRADRMYRYAKDNYTYGLPSGRFYGSSQGRTEVNQVLTTLSGAHASLDYLHFGPPNNLHIGWLRIVAEYGYDHATNQLDVLSAQKGTPVYLTDMVVGVPQNQLDSFEEGALDQWGEPPSSGDAPSRPFSSRPFNALMGHNPVLVDSTAVDDYVRVDYEWEVEEEKTVDGAFVKAIVIKTASIRLSITDAYGVSTDDYFHAKYTANGKTRYWMYRAGDGTYPTLDALYNVPPTENGTFFPFLYFRYDKKSDAEDKTTAAYRTSKKMVKHLGMDFAEVAEAIDENPDIKDVQQAMLVMAVPAASENELEQRYLYSFFENLYMSQGTTLGSMTARDIFNDQNDARMRNTIVIQDKRFKMTLSNLGITKRRVVGNIGAIGEHSYKLTTESKGTEYTNEFGEVFVHTGETKYHSYCRQISDNLYDEIKVAGLQMQYYVIDGYKTTGDEEDDILLIPIDRSIVSSYPFRDRELLYSRSLHYVFNSMQIIKLKWYQTGIFKALMIIVAVVITIVTFGEASPLLQAVLAFTSITVTSAVLITVLNILVGLVVGAVFKVFVKMVGIDAAFILAIVTAAVGLYQSIDAGSLANAPWATNLLQLSNGLTTGISENLKDMFQDLIGEYQAFELFKDAETKKLEAAEDLLGHRSFLEPFVLFGESPTDFYNRTVHSGNIGMAGISAISSYVDIALTLPKFNDTVGGFANG